MLGIMLQKLMSKKWMFFCLLLGCVLLIATVISFPLYENAVFDGMLHDQFEEKLQESGEWPAKIRTVTVSKKNDEGAELFRMEEMMNNLNSFLNVTTKENTFFYRLPGMTLLSTMNRDDATAKNLRLGSMTDLPEHVKMLAGEMYSEDGYDEEGNIEVVVSQTCMVNSNLLVGETLRYEGLKDLDGNMIRLKIVGVIDEVEGDYYWEIGSGELKDACIMEENLFRKLFIENGAANNNTITCCYCYLFEYDQIKAENVDAMMENLEDSEYRVYIFGDIMAQFQAERGRIMATLFILQVPVLVLLGAFLFMISGQMYELERNEISVIKSRGSSSAQIFRLYLYQSLFLAIMGSLLGIPLGVFFCRILGSARNFLEFGLRRNMIIDFDEKVWAYLIVSALVTVLIMTLPAIKHSKISIVNLKQKKATKSRPLWDKFFLDFICLAISAYGYYTFSQTSEVIVENVMNERSLDPLLYVSSSLFIVGAGLLYLRLQPLLIKLIYIIGQKIWKPASYASFMEILKNGRKQQFIMLFLILTIALGTYHATVARTILQNAEANAEYLGGADMIIKEVWRDNSSMLSDEEYDSVVFRYYVPDYDKYSTIEGVESYTKVLNTRTTVKSKEDAGNEVRTQLMAVHTKEYGENTWMEQKLNEDHYYNYLNMLAANPNGVLLSRSYQTQLGYQVGDNISFKYAVQWADGRTTEKTYSILAEIIGFVDYWPTYMPTGSYLSNDGELRQYDNYLMIANYGMLMEKCAEFGEQPYEVWITLEDGADPAKVAEWVNEQKLKVEKYEDRVTELEKTVTDPLLQGTNGVLTMGFLVMIILCAVGYLVYWIMSIRSREMMFGVLRAFGMHKAELFQMLILEQIFSGVLTGFAGIGIGKLVSSMYTPMLQTAYAAVDQVLPMELYTNPADMVRLYSALGLVLAVCLLVLIIIVFKLNVAKALKLGEE